MLDKRMQEQSHLFCSFHGSAYKRRHIVLALIVFQVHGIILHSINFGDCNGNFETITYSSIIVCHIDHVL